MSCFITGAMSCFLDPDTNIMTATMAIYKKTSIVTRAFFTKINSYHTEYTQTGCGWSGTGTDADPFKSTVEVNSTTNQPPEGKSGCGYEIVDVSFLLKYIYIDVWWSSEAEWLGSLTSNQMYITAVGSNPAKDSG